ncbi:aminodeoxychorismate synthase component I [Rhodococcus spongiicola]|uniref:aminodeoxychorismate synthase n=1 Tax=Rhodococcus spongiicola TaxID=2487352 RepID=A0A3S3AAV1_9NOCA|nr:aminodeoxychorismate synthase component I [Rhodococcus spongiicola]RVW03706.1 aminodeoxychorismate synthase component I [Rhodococcus spongiicola]
MSTRTLLIDNYDSFTYNLYSLLSEVNGRPPVVVKNDTDWASVPLDDFDNIVISPGPGRPDRKRDFGISARAIANRQIPVLGVCLGHQGLCHLFGSAVGLAPVPMHGRLSDIRHIGTGIFEGIPSPFRAVRYHSLIVEDLPPELEAQAWTDDGLLMAAKHRLHPLWGVQFHPESICTQYGRELLGNFRDLTPTRSGPASRPEPTRQSSNARGGKPKYVVHSRRVDRAVDPASVYGRLFADGPDSFWLDGSAAIEAESRFSVMGDCSGPLAESVTYRVAETSVCVHRAGRPAERVHQRIFEYIDEQLKQRAVPPSPDLPFAFGLGYIGYLGYELKADVGSQLVHTSPTADAAFVFADRAVVIDHVEGTCYLLALSEDPDDPRVPEWFAHIEARIRELDEAVESPPPHPLVKLEDDTKPRMRHSNDEYLALIGQCLDEIRSGESYEVCLTNAATVDRAIDPVRSYETLREISPTPYSALLKFSGVSVLSASPERFLRIGANRVVESKPIKGTRPRHSKPAEDEALRQDLLDSEKDRAENLMIVDLVRNDLSRVCVPGSVHVPKLFDVETYAPVHQLVSTVRGTLRDDVSTVDCVRAAFPGGSMTGAPKLRTMEIIDKLEEGPRGVYSGAIGYFSINGTADFSIVIRTMVATEDQVTFGVGGAIVALSDPEEELEETMVKAVTMRRCLSVTSTNGVTATSGNGAGSSDGATAVAGDGATAVSGDGATATSGDGAAATSGDGAAATSDDRVVGEVSARDGDR